MKTNKLKVSEQTGGFFFIVMILNDFIILAVLWLNNAETPKYIHS